MSKLESGWWSAFYSYDELTHSLQDFRKDTTLTKFLRILFCGSSLTLIVLYLQFRELTWMLLFFTNWTTWATFFFFSTAVAIQHSKTPSPTWLAIHHILFQTSIVMNILVVIVYWPLLYTLDMNRPEIKASVLR